MDLGAACAEAGIPPGVVNVVTGGIEVGQMLVQDPRVDMVSFTGSDHVGAQIMAQAAPSLKRVLLELGGKSALIIRSDADVDLAVQIGSQNVTFMAGQGCALHTRHLVHHDLHTEYVAKMSVAMRAMPVGDPLNPATVIGPLISMRQRDRVASMVDTAVNNGAELVCGGGTSEKMIGSYYKPTILDKVDNRSPIARTEVFGPVVVVSEFSDDDEAIAMANDSDYGLSGGIVSANPGLAWEMARKLRTGEVQINGGAGLMSPWAPFGGYKRSGIGREYGIEGLDEYSQVKSVLYSAR